MAYNQYNFAAMHHANPYMHSPDLSQFNDYQSASAGSSESFQTQVPLPYYHNNGEEEQRLSTPQQMPSPWATPDLSGSAAVESFQGSSKTLNPTSTPYVPSAQLSHYPIGGQNPQGSFQPTSVYNREGSFSSSSSMMQPYQQGGQIGQIGQVAPYQNTYPCGPQPSMLAGPVGGATLQPHFQQVQQSTGPSYGQYAHPLQQSQGYNSGQHISNAPQSAPFAPVYPPMNTAQNFQGMQYTSGGTHNTANKPWAENVSGLGMHNAQGPSYAGGAYTCYNQSIGFGAGPTMPYNLMNQGSSHASTQESSSASMTSKQSTVTRGETPNYQGQGTIKKAERRVSIQTPLAAKAVRQGQTSSPATVVKNSKSAPRVDQPHRLEIGVVGSRPNLSVSPNSTPHVLGMELSSEPRKVEGVTIRSKRGHTLSSAEPSQKTVFDWLQTTPLETAPARDSSDGKRRASPPKMMSLLGSGGGAASKLKTINENDPFVNRASDLSAKRSATDPFASMQAVVPYNSNNQVGLVGQTSGMSSQLRNLTSNGTRKPSFAEAVDPKTLPFAEICRLAKDDNWGVVKIKNIPYSVNRPEVLAFLGRNAKVVAEYDNEPVHIIMERVTSKTLDCYVEFVNFNEAVAAVNRFETNRTGGRSGRLGHRHVEVELSSQEHLMKDLFPKAKNVQWNGSKPTILPPNPGDMFSSGFQGFVSREEMVMLVKHVESPLRSPFSKDCPQRPFECLISTLIKYPWYMVDFITIEQRNMLHKSTIDLLTLLIERVNSDNDDLCLTPMLLKRAWKAALKCPGFTPAMKDDIIYLCQLDAHTATEYGVPPFAPYWKYLWTIGPKPGAPSDLLLWYIAIIRETTQKRQLSLAEQAAMGQNSDDEKLFGNLDEHLNFPAHLRQMTLAEVARIEWTAIEMLLRQALG